MSVIAHVPLRPVTTKAADSAAQKKAQQAQGGMGGGGGGGRGGGGGGGRGGGGGGRGGGGGGGRRGMMQPEDEKPGSTTIVYLIPEGTKVKAGELLCKLDSSAFEDEEQAQLIRFLQAKSYVEQANSILEVNKISLEEYRDGIYPQDVQLVKQYIEACQLDHDRLERTSAWSRRMQKIGYRTEFQARGDELAFAQTKIALGEAQNMFDRLTKQTGPKLIKALEANVKAIESDKYTQDASFNLEKIRLERIRKNIKNCTLYAPAEGVVVYANQSNAFGMVTYPIAEGVTVRQDQPIINLPDPLHMRVKARINESKLALVQPGQAARINVDAFPGKPMKGRVRDVTAINTPLNASDVRVYFANVDIAQGFAELRPGLSAEVVFLVDSRHNVTRIPLDSIRWVHEHGYVAVYDARSTDREQRWNWKEIKVGLSNLQYAEVLSGVEPGDRLLASPRELPLPSALEQAASPRTKVADLAR
jgi:HlyD family secretion protein